MENENLETLLIGGIAISGFIFFFCLERSIKAKIKFSKITYLIVAIICFVVLMECIMLLTTGKEPGRFIFLETLLFYCIRTIQVLSCLLCLLMSLMIAFKNSKTLKKI